MITVSVGLVRLAAARTVIRDWGGLGWTADEREAAAALMALPDARFVVVPASPWTAKARSANIQTRQALHEILQALGFDTVRVAG